jgi:hypothetical protein
MQARTPGSLGSPEGTTGNGKTAQSYIAGIGASGALLAGAVVTFVFLVGTVSFEVWPAASNSAGGTDSLGVAELSGGGEGSATASLGTTVALIADTIPTPDVIASSAAAPSAGGGIDDGSGGTDGDSGGGGSGLPVGGGDGGTVGEDPGGNPGSGDGENDESDRPSGHRPQGGGDDGPSETADTGSPPTPSGDNDESDRPGGGGRG